MKIGMYTENEIFEYMTECEGSMLGRSMYDAIFDKIHALITENKQLKQDKKFYADAFVNFRNRNDKAIKIVESYNLGKYDYSVPPIGIINLLDALKGVEND